MKHTELSVKDLVKVFLSVLQCRVKPVNTNSTGMRFLLFSLIDITSRGEMSLLVIRYDLFNPTGISSLTTSAELAPQQCFQQFCLQTAR